MSITTQTQQIQEIIQKNPSPNSITDIEQLYQQLIDCLIDHNHRYYQESIPIISDQEYDVLFSYLKKIEETYPYLISSTSPTQSLQGQLETQSNFQKAKHLFPMLSLENSYSIGDIENRAERMQRIFKKHNQETEQEIPLPKYLLEPKFDGISIELIYEERKFIQAITRGDGVQGEDVTANAKTISSIPQTLPTNLPSHRISFRGEVIIAKTMLNHINKQRLQEGLNIYANTRNLASGSIKQLDPNITAKRKLICYIYEAYGFENAHNLYSLKEFGFNFDSDKLDFFTYQEYSLEDLIEKINYFSEKKQQKKIHNSDIEFDGLVIKVKEQQQRYLLGSTAHHPRRAIAYKFPAQQVATQIHSIDFQIGRSGIITPVANLNPVKLSGATISRVSLHNFDFIEEKNIHNQDRVWLQRSGEVIPYIVGVITDRRPQESKNILPPDRCPSCNSKVSKEDIHYFCRNPHCSAQLEQRLIRLVSKNALNIEGVGESIAKILVEQKIIKEIFDIYTLLNPDIIFVIRRFPGFADKKISEIQNQLKKSKNNLPFWRLLNALGISGVGKKTAQDIQKSLELQRDFQNTWQWYVQTLQQKEFLSEIFGLGDVLIQNISNFFSTQIEIIQTIEELNFSFQTPSSGTNSEQEGKGTFSITGSFPLPRPEIIQILEQEGYTFDITPKKTTNIMLIGDKPGSKKQKAEELGVNIISSREEILIIFPSLKNLKTQNIQKTTGPIQSGLF